MASPGLPKWTSVNQSLNSIEAHNESIAAGSLRNRSRLDPKSRGFRSNPIACHVDSANCPQTQRNPKAPNASAGQLPRRNSPGFTYSSD
jgi:hypothetical protein